MVWWQNQPHFHNFEVVYHKSISKEFQWRKVFWWILIFQFQEYRLTSILGLKTYFVEYEVINSFNKKQHNIIQDNSHVKWKIPLINMSEYILLYFWMTCFLLFLWYATICKNLIPNFYFFHFMDPVLKLNSWY